MSIDGINPIAASSAGTSRAAKARAAENATAQQTIPTRHRDLAQLADAAEMSQAIGEDRHPHDREPDGRQPWQPPPSEDQGNTIDLAG